MRKSVLFLVASVSVAIAFVSHLMVGAPVTAWAQALAGAMERFKGKINLDVRDSTPD